VTGTGVRRQPSGLLRPGTSLVELLAVLTLGALLAALVGGMLAAQLRLARTVAERVAAAETIRIALNVMAGEAARIGPADVRAVSADSLSMRGFRGAAVPCAWGPGAVIARYRGDRMPDPTKDSVLVVAATGQTASALVSVTPAASVPGCIAAPDESMLAFEFDAPHAQGLLLVFESGSYYLTSRALRYRLGVEGRQPLTAELLVNGRTRFDAVDASGATFRLATMRGDTVTSRAMFAPAAP
jgi:hypothetical protein